MPTDEWASSICSGRNDLDLVGDGHSDLSSDSAMPSQASWIRCSEGKSQSAPHMQGDVDVTAFTEWPSPASGAAGTDHERPEKSRCDR